MRTLDNWVVIKKTRNIAAKRPTKKTKKKNEISVRESKSGEKFRVYMSEENWENSNLSERERFERFKTFP